jgi:hypothetical protein
MQLQLKPHPWSCLATSFAMAMDVPTSLFEQTAGHDGSEIIFPGLPDPWRRRGFHHSEATYVAMKLGFSATSLELLPVIGATKGKYPQVQAFYANGCEQQNWVIFQGCIHDFRGVLDVRTRSGAGHALAFEKGHIYDPDGAAFPYSREACESRGLYTLRLWRIEKLPV